MGVDNTHTPRSMSDPARRGVSITLSGDDVEMETGCRGIYVGTPGDVKVDMLLGDTAVVFANLPAGQHGMQITKIYSSANGTTASNIVALY